MFISLSSLGRVRDVGVTHTRTYESIHDDHFLNEKQVII